jgi:hypothetical protein
MKILGIDPGPEKSAFVTIRNSDIISHSITPNEEAIIGFMTRTFQPLYDAVVIEMVASYGMAVGASVFDTCVWIGKFWHCLTSHTNSIKTVFRRDIKLHFCGSMRAKDANIRQALIDRFGVPGTKKNPGKLYGIKADEWSALALCVYWQDTHGEVK